MVAESSGAEHLLLVAYSGIALYIIVGFWCICCSDNFFFATEKAELFQEDVDDHYRFLPTA